jgi:putative transposase
MFLTAVLSLLKSRASLQLENIALRHQIGVLQRSAKKRLQLNASDRLLWVWLSRVWPDWRSALVIVKPETVVAWHRKAFRVFWTWKIRRGQPGRPSIPKNVRDLIRTMSRENPLWGAPRIHGELLKLGIEIGETSVSKYLVRSPKPTIPNLENLPRQSRQESRIGGLLYGTHNSVSDPVRVFGAGA